MGSLSDKMANLKNSKVEPEYKPDALHTISEKEIKNIENKHFKVKILVNVSLDLDDKLLDKQQQYRREYGKKVSKEDIIVEILNKHFSL